MEQVKKIAVGALMLGFGGVIYAVIVGFFLPLLGVTTKSVGEDWMAVLGIIGGIIMYFLGENYKKSREQSKDIKEVKDMINDIAKPLHERIDKRTEKDIEQDQAIETTKTEIRLLKIEIDAIKSNMVALKSYIKEEIGDLKNFFTEIIKGR